MERSSSSTYFFTDFSYLSDGYSLTRTGRGELKLNMETEFNFEIWGFEIKIKQLKFIPLL